MAGGQRGLGWGGGGVGRWVPDGAGGVSSTGKSAASELEGVGLRPLHGDLRPLQGTSATSRRFGDWSCSGWGRCRKSHRGPWPGLGCWPPLTLPPWLVCSISRSPVHTQVRLPLVVLSCFPRKRSWLDGRSEGRGWGPGWELSLRALVVRPGSPSRWGRCICGAGPSVCGGLGAAYLCPGVLAPRPRPQRPPGPPAVGSGHCTQLGLSPFLWLQYRPFVFPFILLLLFIKPQKKLLARGIVRTEKREADARRSTWPSSRPGPRAPRWPEQQIPGPALPTWGGRGCGQRGGRGDQVTAAGVPPRGRQRWRLSMLRAGALAFPMQTRRAGAGGGCPGHSGGVCPPPHPGVQQNWAEPGVPPRPVSPSPPPSLWVSRQ